MKLALSRRLLLGAIVALAIVSGADARAADELPSTLLAQLIVKVTSFDKNYAARSQGRPRALVVHKAGDDRAIRMARLLAHDLAEPAESGRALPVDVVPYGGPDALLTALRERSASTVVVVTDLEPEMPRIGAALAGRDTLSFGTNGMLAERGAVVGFDLVAGKPKLVVNLASARAQNVAFRAEFLNLARIVE